MPRLSVIPYLHEAGMEWPAGVLSNSDYDSRGVHRLANVVGNLKVGEGSRIDAFVTITGDVEIGRFTHIGTGCCLFGGAGIVIGDYVGMSPGAKIFTGTEDVGGEWVTNPTVPPHMRNPKIARQFVGDHCFIGTNTVLLPGAYMPDGSGLGALSLCKSPLVQWGIYGGSPARFLKWRTRGVESLINDPAHRERKHEEPTRG